MKKMKKIFALLIAMVMVLGMSTSVFAASIQITTDETYEGDDQAYVYDAYKIFDATYDELSGANTQDAKDEFGYDEDAAVAYFMATGNPWISTVQGLTDYFVVTEVVGGYSVTPKVDKDADGNITKNYYSTAEDAKAVATALKNALTTVNPTGDYAGIEITAGGDAVTVDKGYYLIVGKTAANLALVTTDVTLVEKNEYPHLLKEFTDEGTVGDFDAETDDESSSANDTVQIGDTVSYTLTVSVPSGANQELVITDTFTSGLDPVLDGTAVKITATGLAADTALTASAPADGKFTITMTAADVIKNQGNTLTIVYEAVVTADAWHQTEINTGELKYGSDYTSTTDSVDSVTHNLTIQKKAGSEDGDSLKGAQFKLYQDDATAALKLVLLTDDDLEDAEITKANDTVYYRVAETNEEGATDTIDMTNAYDAVIYGLDGDSTYSIEETVAPTGYNKLEGKIDVEMDKENQIQPVVNNAGSVLPSTGGIGTTIFYVIGAILVIGAGVVLVTRRRMNAN